MKFSSTAILGLLLAAPALGQCDTWQTLKGMSTLNSGVVVDQVLSDNSEFIFYVGNFEDVIVFYVGENGGSYCTGYTQDENGVGTITDGDMVCTVFCESGSGVIISLDAPGLEQQWFAVAPTGETVMLGRSAYRKVYEGLFGTGATDMTLTASSLITPSSRTTTGSTVGSTAFTVTASRVYSPDVDPEDASRAVSYWVGTMSTGTGSLPCAGFSTSDNGVYKVYPIVAFCDSNVGIAFNSYLALTNCDNCILGYTCEAWDATATVELGDLVRDNNACAYASFTHFAFQIEGCGLLAVAGCGTIWIPDAISQEACFTGMLCLLHGVGADIAKGIMIQQEYDRIRDCVCAHAVGRHNGATTTSCTFACPSNW